ncbi:hypothetical protein [Celeribacter halophilus]|uniref:hypothetical protein n=1 Tax=Celeribacter halophilus TaxID=576117 RepID=UPI003A91E0B2
MSQTLDTTEAEQAATELRALRDRLHAEGMPHAAILAGFHAEIIAAMTAAYGPEATIERMVSAADRLEALPALDFVAAVVRGPAGRA